MYRRIFTAFPLSLLTTTVYAHSKFDGSQMNIGWGLPFVLVLLTVAFMPLLNKHFWERNAGKILALWTLLFLVPFSYIFGLETAGQELAHCLIEEYVPFILLLLALYTVAGGILIWGPVQNMPRNNVIFLAVGTALASIMGTTGAAMLIVRPLIRANGKRIYRSHIMLFFIFLVANIGGGLTPIGDPPLFLGFLQGVDFFWTLKYMWAPVLLNTVILLFIFYIVDCFFYKKEKMVCLSKPIEIIDNKKEKLRLYGKINLLLLLIIVITVILSGAWHTGRAVHLLGVSVNYESLARDGILIAIIFASLALTDRQVRNGNEFDWEPMREVAQLFLAIFIVIIPVLNILKAGVNGAFAPLVRSVNDAQGYPIDSFYFWVTGSLSSFLDNAPTYFVFFNLASGNAQHLMYTIPGTLLAISMGAVFMGALTYIGNAPNFMVRSIAIQRGIKMPGFFKYILYASIVLIPIFFIDMKLFLD